MGNEGFLLLNKEAGITSFDLVKKNKLEYRQKNVGHSGTLDKAADGLMILALGKACRILKYFFGFDKEYEFVAKLGFVSDTYDSDGELSQLNKKVVLRSEIEKIINEFFLGEILQYPPKYSALKFDGKRASDILREGGDVLIKPRDVVVQKFEILNYEYPLLSCRVNCSSGTYIRSLVHDLGDKLNVGAYVESLKRTKIGPYNLNDVSDKLFSISEFVKKMPYIELSALQVAGLENGKRLSSRSLSYEGDEIYAFFENNCIGVLEKDKEGSIKLKKGIIK